MTENFARFTIEGTPSEDPVTGDRGYDATAAQNLDVAIEDTPIGVASVTFAVFDPNDDESPQISGNQPALPWTEGGLRTVTPAVITDAVHLVAPAAITSFIIRCTATLLGGGQHVFERLVAVRGSSGLRKTVPAESQQYSQRGYSDQIDEIVDAVQSVAGTFTNPLITDDGFETWLGPSQDARGTTNASGGTTVTSLTLGDGYAYTITFEVWAKNSTGPAYYVYRAFHEAYRDGAGAVLHGSPVVVSEEPVGGSYSVAWSVNSNDVRATFTNAAGQAVKHHVVLTYTRRPIPA